jgi:hypothetical protein
MCVNGVQFIYHGHCLVLVILMTKWALHFLVVCAQFYEHQNGADGTSHSFASSIITDSPSSVTLRHNFLNAKAPQNLSGTIMSLPNCILRTAHSLGT